MASGLRNRLLVLLLGPLFVLGLVNVWVDYRSADSAAVQHDRQLLRYVPLLADSVLAPGVQAGDPPVLLLAPRWKIFSRAVPGSRPTASTTSKATCCTAICGCPVPPCLRRSPSSTAPSTKASPTASSRSGCTPGPAT